MSPAASSKRQAQRVALALAAVEHDARAVLERRSRASDRASGRRRRAPRRRTACTASTISPIEPFLVLGRNDNGDAGVGHWQVCGSCGRESVDWNARMQYSDCACDRVKLRYRRIARHCAVRYDRCYHPDDADPTNRSGQRDPRRQPALARRCPYKVTFVATYHCNFRCEMCNIWQKKSVDEMTPDEVALFFEPLVAVPAGCT